MKKLLLKITSSVCLLVLLGTINVFAGSRVSSINKMLDCIADSVNNPVDICDGEMYVLPGGDTVFNAGTYVDTLVNINMCDSIIYTLLSVHSLPNTNWISFNTICENGNTINLNNLRIPFVTATGGTWSGMSVSSNSFSPLGLGGQNVTITYTVTNVNGCTDSTSHTIRVDVLPNTNWTAPAPLCTNGGILNLNTLLDSTAAIGGTWAPSSAFNPLLLGGQSVPVTYSAVSGTCVSTTTHTIVVNPFTNAIWFNPSPICENVDTINLNDFVVTSGTWIGMNIIDSSRFTPYGLGGQSIPVTYIVASGACADTLMDTIVVDMMPSAAWSAPAKICDGEVVDLNSLVTGMPDGTWTGNSVVDSLGLLIGDVTMGDTTSVEYTVVNGSCQSTEVATISVFATPSVILDLSNIDTLCNSGSVPVIITGAVPVGGNFYGVLISGSQGNYIDPSLATGAGWYMVEYVVTTSGTGCTGVAHDSVYVDICTGIANKSVKQVSLYPNPTNGLVQLANVPAGSIVNVYNVLGESVLATEIFNSNTTIDLTSYTTGIYYVRISNNNAVIFDQKVVKQ